MPHRAFLLAGHKWGLAWPRMCVPFGVFLRRCRCHQRGLGPPAPIDIPSQRASYRPRPQGASRKRGSIPIGPRTRPLPSGPPPCAFRLSRGPLGLGALAALAAMTFLAHFIGHSGIENTWVLQLVSVGNGTGCVPVCTPLPAVVDRAL